MPQPLPSLSISSLGLCSGSYIGGSFRRCPLNNISFLPHPCLVLRPCALHSLSIDYGNLRLQLLFCLDPCPCPYHILSLRLRLFLPFLPCLLRLLPDISLSLGPYLILPSLSLFALCISTLALILAAHSTAALFRTLSFFLALALNLGFSLTLSASLAISAFLLSLQLVQDLSLYVVSASAFSFAYLAFLVFCEFSLISASALDLASDSALSLSFLFRSLHWILPQQRPVLLLSFRHMLYP